MGLGYVGLPVAVNLSKKFPVVGFDVKKERVEELNNGIDSTLEVTSEELKSSNVTFTSETRGMAHCNFYIVAVPTPVSDSKAPDLKYVESASKSVAEVLKKGDIVVYESTVYPGLTEEFCVPILEEGSGLKNGEDFKVGYSPERINPGDKEHSFTKIIKVVSAQDEESLEIVKHVYGSVVDAGIYPASSIKVAEAAKVIENIQRDVNIALMNELAVLFDKMEIDTLDVLEAAGTKWNFLNFRPGLVGGHCIGVDPYYLTHRAKSFDYTPEVILSGRRINDSVSSFVVSKLLKTLLKNGIDVTGCPVTLMGLTFKENCPDTRNSRSIDMALEMLDYGLDLKIYDPWANKNQLPEPLRDRVVSNLSGDTKAYIVSVSHSEFKEINLTELANNGASILLDVKGTFDKNQAKEAFQHYWRL